jgi:hypothetical protein
MIEADDNVTFIKELQRDLARKYRLYGTKAEQIWRSLGKRQRAEVVKAGCADGAMLRDPGDQSLGIVYLLTPEWNLRDLTQPESDHLLQILEHRATNPLTEQYGEGYTVEKETLGQVYIARLKALGAELDPHKTELDLSDFAIPMENLGQPGMAEGALVALDRFVNHGLVRHLDYAFIETGS